MAKSKTPLKTTQKDGPGHYATVNGLRIYYEDHGAGLPLVLLHGGVGASEMFDPVRPVLTEKRRVIAIHLQGHGRTRDIDRPLRFEAMADDVAALLQHLKLDPVDLLGYSLGGEVALQTILRHPDRIRKLVLISTPFQRQGFFPEVLADMAQMSSERARFMDQSPLYPLYPDVEWPVLFEKLGNLLRQDFDWSQEVAAIRSPVMLVSADADAVRPAHTLEFFTRLGGGMRDAGLDGSGRPGARLAVLPGMTHYDILTHPSLAAMVTAFLDAPITEIG